VCDNLGARIAHQHNAVLAYRHVDYRFRQFGV
jgi:hypothetical protein